jgi:hypothetical protein
MGLFQYTKEDGAMEQLLFPIDILPQCSGQLPSSIRLYCIGCQIPLHCPDHSGREDTSTAFFFSRSNLPYSPRDL